jgi:tRNA(Arg) A34 adenosine deaminase TadA
VKHRIVARVYDRRGTLIAQATNSYEKTHPIQAHFAKLCGKPDSIYLHAEVAALLKCGLKRPYSMLIERFKRNGEPGLAKPCPICTKALKHWGVNNVKFTVG